MDRQVKRTRKTGVKKETGLLGRLKWLFIGEAEEGSFKGERAEGGRKREGKGKVPCDGSPWVPRTIKKFHTS